MSPADAKSSKRRSSTTDTSSRPSSSSSGSYTTPPSRCTCAYHLLSYLNFRFCEPHSPEFFKQLAAGGIRDKATMQMLAEAWAEEEIYERSNLMSVCNGDRLSSRVGYLLACEYEGQGGDRRLEGLAEVRR
ncbi:hypothetical protein Tdes44962_MAKER01866 [Teratosphaeria destructans]|uniref:Uncharacterized protein n=1 Tax=Teratosphaeria destructans TaxID=418781 RepID=A0A9W7SWC0_9PEZI|nr:hypothetical protein Tdes44962_MAKER01866 [Teratosphaeria destructans]